MATFKHFLWRFWEYARFRALALVVVSVLSSSLRGFGFLMVLPFLQILGIANIGTSLPGIVEVVVNQWQASPMPLSLTVALIGFVLLISVVALLGFGEKLLQAKLATGFILLLRQSLFTMLIHAPWTYLARVRRAELLQNVQEDTNQVLNAINEFMKASSAAIICAGYLMVALQMSFGLTVACAGVGVGIALLLRPLRRRIERAATYGRRAQVKMFRQVEERMAMIKLIKSFTKEDDETREFNQQSNESRRSVVRITFAAALVPLGYSILGAIGLSCLIAIAIGHLDVSPDRVIVLILVFSRLVPQISRLQEAANRITSTFPALKSIHAREQELTTCVESAVKKPVSPLSLKREIQFANVTFTYPGKRRPSVENLSLTIPANQITALAGSSGAGKSTLADLTLGLLRPEQGTITIDAVRLDGDAIHGWRHSTAYMPQEQLLFHDTIRANLSWAKPDATDEQLWAALDQAAASDFVRKLPSQLDSVVGDRGTQLSGGERQRLSLARALTNSPALLVLDEPTSALDDENEGFIHDALRQLKQTTTILLIAHRQSTLSMADRVIRLSEGRVAES